MSWVDFSKERASTTVNTIPLDDVAYDGYVTAFESAVNAYATGTMLEITGMTSQRFAYVLPSQEAQRENRLTLVYEDDVTFKQGTVSIPTVPATVLTFQGNSDDVVLSSLASLKTAFENLCLSPAGNPVTLIKAYWTGRRS